MAFETIAKSYDRILSERMAIRLELFLHAIGTLMLHNSFFEAQGQTDQAIKNCSRHGTELHTIAQFTTYQNTTNNPTKHHQRASQQRRSHNITTTPTYNTILLKRNRIG